MGLSSGSRLLLGAVAVAMAVSLVPACKRTAPATADGAQLYASMCARCHGAEGKGGVPTLGGSAPRNFTDHKFQADRTDEQLKLSILNGKGASMPPFSGILDEPQINALVAQIRKFDAPGP